MKFAMKPLLVVVSASVLVLSGCSSSGGPSASGGEGECAFTVGWSTWSMNISYYQGVKQGLEDEAEKAGACLVVTNAQLDAAQQLTDAQNLIAQGVDYLAITAVDGKAMIPIAAEANAAGIPVVAVCDLIPSDKIDLNLGMAHQEVGQVQADEIAEFLKAKYGEVRGKVVDVQGVPGTDATERRATGLKELVEKYPGVEVVSTVSGEWTQEGANKVMTDVLQAHPDIDAVRAASDDMSAGVLRAIELAGRLKPVGDPEHIWVGGGNGDPVAVDNIRKGYQDMTVVINPLGMGEYLFAQIKALREDGTPLPTSYEQPSFTLTPENIDTPEATEKGLWADRIGK